MSRPAADRIAVAAVAAAAAVLYLPTLDNYFAQDDFGVVWLLSQKPATYFPQWFVRTWMDDIWGFTPDEIRPFPAVTYQLAAAAGAGSPVVNHVFNIAFHVACSLLVLAIARGPAGLARGAAVVAALAFALLPMHAESVAWVTGRVDTIPAVFYLGAFLLYARWREAGGRGRYLGAVALAFAALFSKQNAVTLVAALALYDLTLARHARRGVWHLAAPWVPFALLTLGYLGLRLLLFGEVAREGMLTPDRPRLFLGDLSVHLRRMIVGEPGLEMPEWWAAVLVLAAGAAVAAAAWRVPPPERRQAGWCALYFVVFWTALGLAPTYVAGYASPRHAYLASVGWAIGLGLAAGVLWRAAGTARVRHAVTALATVVIASYAWLLAGEVRQWERRSMVSQRAVADTEREALAAPPGSLLVLGAPRASWDFALPFAVMPPFASEELTARARFISDSSLHCCPAVQWEAHTRRTIDQWRHDPRRPPVIWLHWDEHTGAQSRLDDRDEPFLRAATMVLAETDDFASLERAIHDIFDGIVRGR